MSRRAFAYPLLGLIVHVLSALSAAPAARAVQLVPSRSQSCVGASAAGAAANHAGLVVTFADRHSRMFCIEFAEDTISGLQLLQRSGLSVVTSASGIGAAVCGIDGEGSNDPRNCFSSCAGGSCAYWAYYQSVNNAWKFSQVGASQRVVRDGDIDGWAWGPGGVSSGATPEAPGEICAPPVTPSPAPTLTPPSATATPSPSPSPISTATRPPTATATRTVTPAGEPASAGTPPATTPPPSVPQPDDPAADAPPSATAAPVARATTPAESAVLGGARSPIARTPLTSVTASPTAPATPLAGSIAVSADEGKRNESNSAAASPRASGGAVSFIWFAVVAAGVVAVAGAVAYRRRHAG
jgi:hypothetical protein